MTDDQGPRWSRVAFWLAVGLVAMCAISWLGGGRTPSDVPSHRPVGRSMDGRENVQAMTTPAAVPPTRHSSPANARNAAPATTAARVAVPTPGVFDFASITPRQQRAAAPVDERFVPNEHLTQEDLDHPERYFDAAARVPALNEPEARRDTLDFFRAYRAQLERDLEAPEHGGRRSEILATIARYDDAIGRLRELIEAQ